ncbi:MAG: hypothetical protein U5N86_04135 [Planctomycetota bacterium]|nr:hypothetical protein [Planctomycetota bacterium]
MKRWEYHVVKNITETHLDEMGGMGWELVTVVNDPRDISKLVYYFRRELD